MFRVEYSKKAHKSLSKLDRQAAVMIYDWIEENLVGCDNPRTFGRLLTADWRGCWRYKVGGYRIIAEILDRKVLIHIIDIGHRREIYR